MAAVKSALRGALIMAALLGPVVMAPPAAAQVSIEVAIPGARIGIVQPVYPDLVLVPGYPVYYAPQSRVNYFFHDGFYWVFHEERWYMSSWYDGPWDRVDPYHVPLFVLRVPVAYYVNPPPYFFGWVHTAPPRWELYWGPRWAEHHHGWDHWDRRAVPRPVPPPLYQRYYSGERYPRREHQQELREQHHRYQPREAAVQRQPGSAPATQPQPHPAATSHFEIPRAPIAQQDRSEVRRYAPAAAAAPQWSPAREPVLRERRSPSAMEPERHATITPAAPDAPATPQVREQTLRAAPLQDPFRHRSPQVFEHRPAARPDPGPREPQVLRVPQHRESRPQVRDLSPGHPGRSRGHP